MPLEKGYMWFPGLHLIKSKSPCLRDAPYDILHLAEGFLRRQFFKGFSCIILFQTMYISRVWLYAFLGYDYMHSTVFQWNKE